MTVLHKFTALVGLGCIVFAGAAVAQGRGPLAITITTAMSCCVGCPYTTPVIASVTPRDVGGGVIDVDLVVLSTTATPVLTVTRTGYDIFVRIDAPRAEDACTLRARITGVPRGAYVVHLIAVRDMYMAALGGRVVPAGGELARATVAVR